MRDVRFPVVLPLVALLSSGAARADERLREPTHAERGAFVVTFERLLGYSIENVTSRFAPERAPRHLGMGALLGPRIGFHGVVPGGLTVGGSLGTLAILDEGRVERTLTVLGPRVGWWFQSEVLGVWPRAGLTFLTGSRDVLVSYAAELSLTIALGRHAGVLVGPSVELPTERQGEQGFTALAFTAGLYGAF